MGSEEKRHHHDHTKCRACGTEVAIPLFFDTRGHHYCAPECWESVGDSRGSSVGGMELG